MPGARELVVRERYNRAGWVLCKCKECGRLNYVEPHGTTAQCKSKKCKGKWTEHENLSYAV